MEIFQSVFQNIWRNRNCFWKNWIKILQESLHIISCSLKLMYIFAMHYYLEGNRKYHDINFYREYTCTAIRNYLVAVFVVGSLSNDDGDGWTKTSVKKCVRAGSNFIAFSLFYLVQFVKCWRICLELDSKRTVSKFRKRGSWCCVHALQKQVRLGSFTS